MQKTQKPTSKNSLKHPIPKLLHIVENESLKCLQYDQYSKTGSPNDTKFTILRLVSTFSNMHKTTNPHFREQSHNALWQQLETCVYFQQYVTNIKLQFQQESYNTLNQQSSI